MTGGWRQRGVALITALLVTALAAVLAALVLQRHSLALARAQAQIDHAQAVQYLLGAEQFARQLLFDDFEASAGDDGQLVDFAGDTWANALPPFDIEGGALSMQIRDLSGRFNLNALAAPEPVLAHQRLRTLMFSLGLQESHADTLLDWLDADDQVTGLGAEDSAYLAQQPPYLAANQPLASATELALLQQMDADTLAILLPHVAVLPTTAMMVNVNTAQAPVLQALVGPDGQLPPLVADGARGPYRSQQELVREAPVLAAVADQLQLYSSFFEVLSQCRYGERVVRMRTVLYRDPNTGALGLVSRELGNRLGLANAPDDSSADSNTSSP